MEHPVCTGHDKDHKAIGALHDAIAEMPADEVGRVGDERGEEKQHERPQDTRAVYAPGCVPNLIESHPERAQPEEGKGIGETAHVEVPEALERGLFRCIESKHEYGHDESEDGISECCKPFLAHGLYLRDDLAGCSLRDKPLPHGTGFIWEAQQISMHAVHAGRSHEDVLPIKKAAQKAAFLNLCSADDS